MLATVKEIDVSLTIQIHGRTRSQGPPFGDVQEVDLRLKAVQVRSVCRHVFADHGDRNGNDPNNQPRQSHDNFLVELVSIVGTSELMSRAIVWSAAITNHRRP